MLLDTPNQFRIFKSRTQNAQTLKEVEKNFKKCTSKLLLFCRFKSTYSVMMLISEKIIKKQIFSWIKCKRIVAMSDSTINGIQNNYGGIKLLK